MGKRWPSCARLLQAPSTTSSQIARSEGSSRKARLGQAHAARAPEVHGAALVAAQAAGKSLNQWATEVIQEAAHV